jgi:hypothetical protein
MAKNPGTPKKPAKTPKSKAHRPDVQPIGPALAELLNPAINRGDAGMGSGTGLQPPPDNSWDRRAGGEAAAHRARASTRATGDDVAKRDANSFDNKGFDEAPQSEFKSPNYGTSATIPTLDPELARQLGLPTAEDDDEALARPPRSARGPRRARPAMMSPSAMRKVSTRRRKANSSRPITGRRRRSRRSTPNWRDSSACLPQRTMTRRWRDRRAARWKPLASRPPPTRWKT